MKAAVTPDRKFQPGGLALILTMRLPTGSRENLRPRGVSHAGIGLLRREGTVQAHLSGGFEFWSKSVDVPTCFTALVRFVTRCSSPPDSKSRHTQGDVAPRFPRAENPEGGEDGVVSDPAPANTSGITSIQSLVVLPEGILKGILVPGIKVNLKGKLLLSLNALVTVKNNGLHSKVTPVVGLNLGL